MSVVSVEKEKNTLHFTVSLAPSTTATVQPSTTAPLPTGETSTPLVGFAVEEKTTIVKQVIVALSEKAFDFVAASGGVERKWAASNGFTFYAGDPYSNEFRGSNMLFMSTKSYRGKRCIVSQLYGHSHIVEHAEKLGVALKELATAAALTMKPVVDANLFAGLQTFE